MKVLLVSPKFPDTYWGFHYALPFEGKRSAFPPLGLLTVSALLPSSWERRLIDMNVEPLKASHYQRALSSLKQTAQRLGKPQHYEFVNSIAALTRLICKLGVLDGERKEFWRFFSKALVQHHNMLADALRLAAMGYHFRKLNCAYASAAALTNNRVH